MRIWFKRCNLQKLEKRGEDEGWRNDGESDERGEREKECSSGA